MSTSSILSIEDLTVEFKTKSGTVPLVRNVNLKVKTGSWLGVVGESGSGKSILALSILRLLPPRASILSGHVFYQDIDLLQSSEADMQEIRGREISVIFQNALSALNPLFTAGDQIADVYRFHHGASRKESQQKVVELLGALGLTDPETTAKRYPHQLSGGMAQRVMIAMALISSPRLLIADDPTSTLDATIQAQVLDILVNQVCQRNMSMLLISRDIRLVSALCTEIAVMRAGEILEAGPVGEILSKPTHPYTRQLLADVELDAPQTFSKGWLERCP